MANLDPNVWPKTYILKLYQDAIEHGCIRVSPLSEAQAKSLTLSIYRLRRRKDRGTADFIQPEFQLVSVTHWTPDYGGSIHVIYSSMPADQALPTVTPVPPEEAEALFTPPTTESALPEDLVLATEEIDVGKFVSSLRRQQTETPND